jgi:hydroxyacylglutathione hydrolase
MNKIVAIPAFKDNYIWAVHSLEGSQIVVVDPGAADPVFDYLQNNNLTLTGILVTHHHWDHSGGVPDLMSQFPEIKAYGPAQEKVAGLTHLVKENDEISFAEFGLDLHVIDIPGHTLGHIAYVGHDILFCGDTLFSCGCGRIFEGTPAQMYHSLDKIKKLSKNTQIYCGHEYTLANMTFAQLVEPKNKALYARQKIVKDLRLRSLPSLPVTLATELETNPFLRCNEMSVVSSVQKHVKATVTDPVSVFAHLREWKNHF